MPGLRDGARKAWLYAYERVALALALELRQVRQAQGVSVEELAAAVGIAANTVHQYERGRTVPHVARLAQLAWALGLAPGSLLDGLAHGTGGRAQRRR